MGVCHLYLYLVFEVTFDCKRIGLVNCRTDYIADFCQALFDLPNELTVHELF